VTSSQKPHLAAFNKIDLTPPAALQANWEAYEQLLPAAPVYGVSATRGDNLDQLLEGIVERLPAGPAYFPDAELTDSHERELAADLIRAAALQALRQEVPHSIAVLIDEFRERHGRGAWIAATLFVERESQKGIVIGKGGHMLREIGTLARKDIERMSGRTIYLQLRVKVLPKWRNDEQALRRLGYRSRTPSRRP
jgi:GTP-binding protein Era